MAYESSGLSSVERIWFFDYTARRYLPCFLCQRTNIWLL